MRDCGVWRLHTDKDKCNTLDKIDKIKQQEKMAEQEFEGNIQNKKRKNSKKTGENVGRRHQPATKKRQLEKQLTKE